jgi:3-hydroxybutyrate dehydrogenase
MRVLVTGAASGIGRAAAARLEQDGARVLSVDLDPGADSPGEPFGADLTTRDGNRTAVAAAVERFGGLDVVVANAGLQHVAPVRDFGEDEWDRLIALLLTSPFLLAKYAWQALAEAEEGRFIGVASVHGLVASPFKAAYVAAKHGLVGLVKTLALEGPTRGSSPRRSVRRSCARRWWRSSSPTRPRRKGCPRSACWRRWCLHSTRSSA